MLSNSFGEITNFTLNVLRKSFFPGDSEDANRSKVVKNSSQGIIFVMISCQGVSCSSGKVFIVSMILTASLAGPMTMCQYSVLGMSGYKAVLPSMDSLEHSLPVFLRN